MKKDIIEKLDRLHEENDNEQIITKILGLEKDELDSEILGKLARAYMNSEKYEKGLEVLHSIKEDTALWNWRVGYGNFYLDLFEEAEKHFLKSLELNPEDTSIAPFLTYINLFYAKEAQEEQQYTEAIKYYKKAIKFNGDTEDIIDAELSLGWIYDALKDYKKAYKHLKNGESLLGSDENIWLISELGYNRFCLEKYDEALDLYKRAVELGREDGWIFYRLGENYMKLDLPEKAYESFLKAESLMEEESGDSLNIELGDALLNSGKLEEALAYYFKELERKEDKEEDVLLYSKLALVYNKLGNNEEGLKYLLKIENLGAKSAWLYSELGLCLGQLGRYEEGIEKLNEALSYDDEAEKTFIYSTLGYLYGKLLKNKEALDNLYLAKSNGRDDDWLNAEIAWNLSALGKYEEALPYFKKILELGRDDEWTNSQIGFAYSRIEKLDEAVKYFKRANEIVPYNPWTLYHLGICNRKLGNIEMALENLNKASEVCGTDYQGWLDLEYAWCYVLIDERDKAKEYLENVKKYLSSLFETDYELLKDYEKIESMLNTSIYFS